MHLFIFVYRSRKNTNSSPVSLSDVSNQNLKKILKTFGSAVNPSAMKDTAKEQSFITLNSDACSTKNTAQRAI